MNLTDLDTRLLGFVPREEPATATEIWRWFSGLTLTDGRLSMTRKMRRQRRETAARLEDLAYDGYIKRVEVRRHGIILPAYRRID